MFAKLTNAFHRGRRRFISREEAVDVPDPEPAVFHHPPVSKVYPPTGGSTKPSPSHLGRAATIDYAPTASSVLKDASRSGSRSSETGSRSATFGRSQTADSNTRWARQDAVHPSDRSPDPRVRGAQDAYPQTYPGSARTSQDRDRLSDISDTASTKLASPSLNARSARRLEPSPRVTSHRIEEVPEPADLQLSPTQQRASSRLTRGSSTESGIQYGRGESEDGRRGMRARRQDKRARALAMEAAQQSPKLREPVALQQIRPPTLRPPDSPLIQHAPRKAQPFLGARSNTIDVATLSQASKSIVPPSPVPPWRSKEKPAKVDKVEKQKKEKERVVSPVWEGPVSPKSSNKSSKSSQRVLSPTALLVASSSRLMSPVAMPTSPSPREEHPKSPISPPKAAPEKESSPSVGDDAQARADRIAQYKEQRRKELANLYSPPGQDARSKTNPDTNLENFMKHAKKYGLDKAIEEKSSNEDKKLGSAPLVATVAPMVTSAVTSPITSTATVTSPTTTTSSKGSAVVTLSKSDEKPIVTSPPRVVSPSTLTSTRVTATQGLAALSPTKLTSPTQSYSALTSPKVASPPSVRGMDRFEETEHKVTSPGSKRVTSPIEKISSPGSGQVTSPVKDALPQPGVLSPQNARRLFFAGLDEEKDIPASKPSPSFIPKVVKPTSAAVAMATVTSTTATTTVTSSTSATPSLLSPKSQTRSKLRSPSKVTPVSSSSAGQLLQTATKELPVVSMYSRTVTSPVISTVTSSVTNTATSMATSHAEPTSISVSDILKTGRSKLHGDVKSTESTVLTNHSRDSVKALHVDDGIDKIEPVFSKVKPLDEGDLLQSAVTTEAVVNSAAMDPKVQKGRRPVHLHIEEPVLPELALTPKFPPLAEPEELLPEPDDLLDETIPDPIFTPDTLPAVPEPLDVAMEELEAEVRLMESLINQNAKEAEALKSTEIPPHAVAEDLTPFDDTASQPKTPTTPSVSHADLYEQAIASKKRAFEDEKRRREDEVAAEVELKKALKVAKSQEIESKSEAIVMHQPVLAHSPVAAARPQVVTPEAICLSPVQAKVLPPAEFLSSPPGEAPTEESVPMTTSVSSSASKTPTTPVSPVKATTVVSPVKATTTASPVKATTPASPVKATTPVSPVKGTTTVSPVKAKPGGKSVTMGKIEDSQKKRVKELVREDSFNRADSPIREPMPLPKDSVIARHRQSRSRHRTKQNSSSSESETSPPRSPRTSPRSPRKPKGKGFVGGRDATGLGVDYVPQEKERGRSGRPDRHHGDTSPVVVTSGVHVTSGPSPSSLTPTRSPVTADVTPTSPPGDVMGQNGTKQSSVLGQGESLVTSPLYDVTGHNVVIDTSPLTSSRHGSDAGPPLMLGRAASDSLADDVTSFTTGPSSLVTGVSDTSSTGSSHRKRYKKREPEEAFVPVGAAEVKVRAGKKDKSSVRKSTLNTLIDEEEQTDTRRSSDARRSSAASDDVLESAEARRQQRQARSATGRRSRDESLTSPEPLSDVTSPVRRPGGAAQVQSPPYSPAATAVSPTRTLSPVTIDSRVRTEASVVPAQKPVSKDSTPSKFTSATTVQRSSVTSPTKDTTAKYQSSSVRRSPEKSPTKGPDRQSVISGRVSPSKSLQRKKSPEKTVLSPTSTTHKTLQSPLSPKAQDVKTSSPIKVSSTIVSPVEKKTGPSETVKSPISAQYSPVQSKIAPVSASINANAPRAVSTTTKVSTKSEIKSPTADSAKAASTGPKAASSQLTAKVTTATATTQPQVTKVATVTQPKAVKVTAPTIQTSPTKVTKTPEPAAATLTSPAVSPIKSPTQPSATKVTRTAQIVTSKVTSPTKPAATKVTTAQPIATKVTSPTQPAATKVVTTVQPIVSKVTSPAKPSAVQVPTSTVQSQASKVAATTAVQISKDVSAPKAVTTTTQSSKIRTTATITPSEPAIVTKDVKSLPEVSSTAVVSPTSPTERSQVSRVQISSPPSGTVSPVYPTSPEPRSPPISVSSIKSPTSPTERTEVSRVQISSPVSGTVSPVYPKSPEPKSPISVSSTVKSPTSPTERTEVSRVQISSPLSGTVSPVYPKSPEPKLPFSVSSTVKSPTSPTEKTEVSRVQISSPLSETVAPTYPTSPEPKSPISLSSIKSPTSPTKKTEVSHVQISSPLSGTVSPAYPTSPEPRSPISVSSTVKSPTVSSSKVSPVSSTPAAKTEQFITPQRSEPQSVQPVSAASKPVSPPPLVSSIQIKPTSPIVQEPTTAATKSPLKSQSIVKETGKDSVQRTDVLISGGQKQVQASPAVKAEKSAPVHTSAIKIQPTSPTSPVSPTSSVPKEVDYTKYGIPEKVGEPLVVSPPKAKVSAVSVAKPARDTTLSDAIKSPESVQSMRAKVPAHTKDTPKPVEFGAVYRKKTPVEEKPKPVEFGTTYKKKDPVEEIQKPAQQTKVAVALNQTSTRPTPKPETTTTSTTVDVEDGRSSRNAGVSDLVRRFSSPEPDTDRRSPTPRSRRTPERSQSMREDLHPQKRTGLHSNGVHEAPSAAKDMNRRRFNAVPADEQLARILKRRSRTLEEWEAELELSTTGNDVSKDVVTSQDLAIKEYEAKLEQQKMGKTKEDAISDDEVSNALKARRVEVDQANDVTTQVTPETNQNAPVKRQSSTTSIELTPVGNEQLVSPKQKKPEPTSPIQISSIVTTSRDTTADRNAAILKKTNATPLHNEPVVTSRLKSEVTLGQKVPTSPQPTSPAPSATSVTSLQSPTSPTSPSHQTSTFIMVTSAVRKPADPYVEMAPSSGQPQVAAKSVTLQRSETLKEQVEPATAPTVEANRKPLKPILRKAKTVDVNVWDPELEEVLRQRREREAEEQIEEETVQNGRSAEGEGEDGESEEPKLSIAERIFKMETRIEETKFSKSYTGSGATTPRVVKLRSAVSGPASPGNAPSPRSQDQGPAGSKSPPVNLADDQLFAKLTDVAVTRDAADRRRQHFQQRKDVDWRTRTMPVTEAEVVEADRLESELKDIPETSVIQNEAQPALSRKKMVRKKVEAARAAFFEDSDSDFDKMVEINKRREQAVLAGDGELAEDVTEEVQDDLSKMSVGQKMALFRKMEEEEKDKKKSPGSKRFQDRRTKRMERSRTQPITEEEIGQAAVIAKEQKAEQEEQAQSQQGQDDGSSVTRSISSSFSMENLNADGEDGKEESPEDDLSKLSISEKMKLFSQQQEENAAPKRDAPVIRRKTRRLQSRFKTQSGSNLPITNEEVEKAAHRISPLALSLVKPPDPELLQTMTLRDQKKFMAKWATDTLQQLGSRPTSQTGSRSTSRPGSDGEEEKDGHSKEKSSVRGILKPEQKAELERELRGILRAAGAPYPLEPTISYARADPAGPSKQPPSILKKLDTPPHHQQQEATHSILKKDSSFEPKAHVVQKGMLKKSGFSESRTVEPEKPAIRLDQGPIRAKPAVEESRGILRRDVVHPTEVKSVLKVTSSAEVTESAESNRGILKTRTTDTPEPEVHGILRSPPIEISSTEVKVTEVSRPVDLEVTSRLVQGQRPESSTEEDSSASGGAKRIKNEAVARRRAHRELRKQGERYHTQPIEGSSEDGVQPSSSLEARRAGLTRHHTQPITSEEKEEAETGKVKDGIASRLYPSDEELALLQRSGEDDWKRRVHKKEPVEGEVRMREKKTETKQRPSSIADRLSLLQGSQESWRERIEETDVKQFTVAGKLELTGKAMTPDSPLLARRRKPKVPLARGVKRGAALSTPIMHVDLSDDEQKTADGPVTVDVPQADDEAISEFFQSRTQEELAKDKVKVSVDDFDHIFMESQDILTSVQKARPQTRRATASKNPLKTLAQRRDIQSEYIQVRSDVADREMRRIKREQIAGSACFATEALAGLAATENFAQVMLRKTDSFTSGTPGSQQLEPYKPVMLLQVKGRRHCQTRLVAPDASSLNSGDCFILVTPERCWCWIGEFSNVIEKAKAVEVASVIQQKRDLGCKSNYEPTVMEEQAATVVKRFWEVLGGEADYQDVGPAEEDEVYEADMAETVRVYRLAGEEFVLWEEVSGCVPRYEMLNTKDILIFDFGSEFYLWTGKQAAFSKRKVALRLAREKWSQGYDYTSHGFNPMCPLTSESEGGLPLSDSTRPDWTLFGKVNQNMETVLFREKFFDWPDASRLISVKGNDDEAKTEGAAELTAYDVTKMLPLDTSPVTLVLEGSHVGRGNSWTEYYEGLRREYEISTLSTKVWHVNEYQIMELDDVSYGQFHDGDTYVVRWQYMVMQTGMKTLKGTSARHSLVGRERCAYFFWQGRHSSVNEKGASALMTVELDEERGPQVRVLQDKEQPCFLNLFKSKMVVHIGKRESEDACTQGDWKLYVVRNELSGEAHLTEVECALSSLRSRGSFVLINIKTGQILLWNGHKSGQNTRQRALEIAQNLKSSCPQEMGISDTAKLMMTKMDEGCESRAFFTAMGSTDTSVYVSLLDDVRQWNHTPRLFLMSSVSGEFRATEVMNPCRSGDTTSAFPFLQGDLYGAPQPGQLLVDNDHEVFLWQGWWPEGTEESENVSTGSAIARFNTDRVCAMETVLNYCHAKNPVNPTPAFVVYAGLEPKGFTNLFPYWEHSEEAANANLKEGKKAGARVPVKDLLRKLTCTKYTYDELQERPLPDGVDPMRIEAYLQDNEFERVLEMTREEFYERPAWKQSDLKKEHSLF